MLNPYDRLYIYYFDGILRLDTADPLDRIIQHSDAFLGNWVEEEASFLFFSSPCDEMVEKILEKNAGIHLVDKYEMTGEQWHGDKIEPYYVNDLCIFPPWNKPEKNDASVKGILLDPGVVFGTGRHQTTEDCLYLIHRLCTTQRIETVLDIGTGTGLLSLGAAVLGCGKVLACDFNLLAVQTALTNIRLNKLQDRILAFQARGEEILSIPCDLLVANIHYDVMQHIIESPFFLEKKWFILSGLLKSETKKIMAALSLKKVHIIERRCPDGIWNTLLGEN